MHNIDDLKKYFGQFAKSIKRFVPQQGQLSQPEIQQDEVAKVPAEQVQQPAASERTQIDKNHSLLTTVANRDPAGIRYNIEDGADIHFINDAALRNAVSLGYRDVIETLLQLGADVHAEGEFPLYTAIRLRDFDLADRLVQQGANIDNMLTAQQELTDPEFMTALDDMRTRASKAAFEKNYEALSRTKAAKPSFKTPKPQPGL